MKNCIVTLATTKNNYIKGMARLSESLRNNFDGDFIGFTSEVSVGAPLHTENPYAFKIYAIEKALEAGYTKILWLDSSCFAIKNVQPIFDHITDNGYIMQDAGHWIGQWTNDKTLEYFGVTRDEMMDVRCYGNAGFLGLDFENNTALEFFQRWKQSMLEGLFVGAWTNNDKTESQDERCTGHRHDLSCGSIIRYQLGMELQGGEEWLQYAAYYPTLNESIIIKAEGL